MRILKVPSAINYLEWHSNSTFLPGEQKLKKDKIWFILLLQTVIIHITLQDGTLTMYVYFNSFLQTHPVNYTSVIHDHTGVSLQVKQVKKQPSWKVDAGAVCFTLTLCSANPQLIKSSMG